MTSHRPHPPANLDKLNCCGSQADVRERRSPRAEALGFDDGVFVAET